MARIIYTIGELMGSVGGLTFQRNSSGKIVRFRPTVGKKSTSKQQAQHLSHNNLLRGYSLLTLSQKIEWSNYASTYPKTNKFGQEKMLTGQNWFESLNFYRGLLSLSLFTNPPAHNLPSSPPTFEIIITASTISINFTSAHDFSDSPIIIWVSIPTLRNTNSINQIRRFAKIVSATPSNPLDITTEWEQATGLDFLPESNFPNANLFVCLESVKANSGITSPMVCSSINASDITSESSTLIYYT